MKRPLAAIGFLYLAAQIISVFFGLAVSVTLFIVCVLLFCGLFLIPEAYRKTTAVLLVTAAVSFAVFIAHALLYTKPAEALEGKTAYIHGRITEQPYNTDGRFYYYVKTDSIDIYGAPQKVKVRLSSAVSAEADIDDIISCRVTFSRADDAVLSSSAVRLRARGVAASGYMERYGEEIEITKGKVTFYGRIVRLRMGLVKRMRIIFGGEYSALLTGMLLGDTSYMDDGIVRSFRRSGISHYLAVSGLHLALFSFMIERILLLLHIGIKRRSAMLPVFIFFFMALTGFSASVTRAGFMQIFYYISRALFADNNPLNSLGTSVLIMCIHHPYAAADIGMLMSVSATLGLIKLAPYVERYASRYILKRISQRYHRPAEKTVSVVSASFVASLAVFPVSALYFDEVSIVAVPCNLLCIYPAYGFMVAGALATLLSLVPFIGGYICMLFVIPAKLCGWLLIKIAELFASPSWASLSINYRCLPWAMLTFIAVIVTGLIIYRGRDKRSGFRAIAMIVAFSILLFCTCIFAESAVSKRTGEIYVFDAGSGIACFVRKGGSSAFFCTDCDTHKLWQTTDQLNKLNMNMIDNLVLLSGNDNDFYCAESITNMYRPKRVYFPEGILSENYIRELCDKTGSESLPFTVEGVQREEAGSFSLWSGGNISFELITDSSAEVWCWINAGGLTALIAPDEGDCARLTGKLHSPDIVILRSDSVSNVSSLRTMAVVISADGETASRTEALLRYRGVKNICSTLSDGSMRISLHKDGIKAEELS